MRRILLFVALTTNLILRAQSIKIGLVGQPNLSYYTVQTDLSGLAQDFRQQHKPIITYHAGILGFKELSKSVNFVTGLIFAQRGLKSQYNTSNITAFNFSNSGFDLKVIDRYIEIPLLLNVYFNQGKTVKLFGSFGLKPSFYLNSVSKVVGSSSNYSSYVYAAHRKFNIFASLGLGLDIKLSSRLNAILWPAIDHALISEVYAVPLKLYPYSAGINLCLVYSLGN